MLDIDLQPVAGEYHLPGGIRWIGGRLFGAVRPAKDERTCDSTVR